MAQAALGISVRQAALLLRCQQLRVVRLQGHLDRCSENHEKAIHNFIESQAAARDYQRTADVAIRKGYDGLIGQENTLVLLAQVQQHEAEVRATSANHEKSLLEKEAAKIEAGAQERDAHACFIAASQKAARREHLLQSVSRVRTTQLRRSEERRRDDEVTIRTSWR